MSSLLDALLVVAIATNGLLAGLFFVFACAVAPGLGRVEDTAYVQAFRSINRAIVNGRFLVVLFAAPLAALACAVLGNWQATEAPLSWAGTGCAALTFIITAAANVPLNTRLERAAVRTGRECRVAREQFEARWNQWNLVRTITSIGALVSFAITGVLG